MKRYQYLNRWIGPVILVIFCFTATFSADAYKSDNEDYVHEQSFTVEHNMTGLRSSLTEFFHVGNWEIHEADLTLVFSSTPLVQQDVSDFTISLNGRRFYSQRIPYTDGEIHQIQIKLPIEEIKEGANSIRLEAYIRTNDSDYCVDDISTASWMNVLTDSSVALSYTPKAKCENIADCFAQFTSVDALENQQSTVFIPTSPAADELTVAALALTGLSQNAVLNYQNIKLTELSDETMLAENKYSIYIAKYSSLVPSILDLLNSEQKQAAAESAVIALLSLQENNHILVVTGEDFNAFNNAGRLLGNQPFMQQTKATWRKIAADENTLMPHNDIAEVLKLSDTGSYLNGPFRQTAVFFIDGYANRFLAANSKVDLFFRYSENLDFNRSLVTAYIDDIPIGSKKLTKEGANGDSASFLLPSNLDVSGNFVLKVAFDLEIPDMVCTVRQEEMPWAYISENSTIEIHMEKAADLLFDYYPGPFVEDGKINNTVVIMPFEPSEADLDVLRSLMLGIGKYLKDNTGSLRIVLSTDMGDLSNANIISVGRFEDNPIAKELNDQLFFQFSHGGTTILSNEKIKIEPNYGSTLGTAQLLNSPYSSGKNALLILSGVRDQGMLNAVYYMGTEEEAWKIFGDGFIADDEKVYCFRFKKAEPGENNLQEILGRQKDLIKLGLVGGGVIFLLIVAIIFILIKNRKGKKR